LEQTVKEPVFTPDIPRIRYYHGAAWIAIFAVLLVIQNWQLRAWNTSRVLGVLESEESGWQIVYRYVTAASAGISIALVMFGLRWRRRGISVPNQPGHWLALFHAVAFSGATYSQIWSARLEAMADQAERNNLAARGLLLLLVWAGGIASVSFCLACWRKQDKQWRAVYLLITVLMCLMILPVLQWLLPLPGRNGLLFGAVDPVTFRRYAPLVISGILVGGILHCAATDLLYERRRDWAHWSSVVAYLTTMGLTLANHAMLL
jgi:hypothetical protein